MYCTVISRNPMPTKLWCRHKRPSLTSLTSLSPSAPSGSSASQPRRRRRNKRTCESGSWSRALFLQPKTKMTLTNRMTPLSSSTYKRPLPQIFLGSMISRCRTRMWYWAARFSRSSSCIMSARILKTTINKIILSKISSFPLPAALFLSRISVQRLRMWALADY